MTLNRMFNLSFAYLSFILCFLLFIDIPAALAFKKKGIIDPTEIVDILKDHQNSVYQEPHLIHPKEYQLKLLSNINVNPDEETIFFPNVDSPASKKKQVYLTAHPTIELITDKKDPNFKKLIGIKNLQQDRGQIFCEAAGFRSYVSSKTIPAPEGSDLIMPTFSVGRDQHIYHFQRFKSIPEFDQPELTDRVDLSVPGLFHVLSSVFAFKDIENRMTYAKQTRKVMEHSPPAAEVPTLPIAFRSILCTQAQNVIDSNEPPHIAISSRDLTYRPHTFPTYPEELDRKINTHARLTCEAKGFQKAVAYRLKELSHPEGVKALTAFEGGILKENYFELSKTWYYSTFPPVNDPNDSIEVWGHEIPFQETYIPCGGVGCAVGGSIGLVYIPCASLGPCTSIGNIPCLIPCTITNTCCAIISPFACMYAGMAAGSIAGGGLCLAGSCIYANCLDHEISHDEAELRRARRESVAIRREENSKYVLHLAFDKVFCL